jgi:hypothetical protein
MNPSINARRHDSKVSSLVLLSISFLNPAALASSWKPIDASFSEQQEARKADSVLHSFTHHHSKVQLRQGLLWAIPVATSLLAFTSFKSVTQGFESIVKALGDDNSWIPDTEAEVDLQTQVITQVVNGPVITSISVLFATLVSITISFLHDRQIKIKSCEARTLLLLRNLQHIVKQLPESMRQDATLLTHDYAESLIRDHGEVQRAVSIAPITTLHKLQLFLQTQMANAKSRSKSPLTSMAYECVSQIQETQSNRCLFLQNKFPLMHFTTLGLLALAICISFLVATNQSRHVMESLPVKMLWSILVGAFTSLAVVCYDLSAPFVGAYRVSRCESVDELTCLKLSLAAQRQGLKNTPEYRTVSLSHYASFLPLSLSLVLPVQIRLFQMLVVMSYLPSEQK